MMDDNTRKALNKETAFFRDLQFNDAYDSRWREYADAMDKVISTFVPVVRCKDCVYWQDNNGGYPHVGCKWREDETPDSDDFCSAGELTKKGAKEMKESVTINTPSERLV